MAIVSVGTFPFGRPVLPRPPSASTRRRVFILGAYPSALHVAWRPPRGKPIRAMAVDNEPVPFWNGHDEDDHVARWKAAVGFRDVEWGGVTRVGDLNGSSGLWVDNNVLGPLGAAAKRPVSVIASTRTSQARAAQPVSPTRTGLLRSG